MRNKRHTLSRRSKNFPAGMLCLCFITHSSCALTDSPIRTSYITELKIKHIKRKARESVPVTRPAYQGSRIAHRSLNEQRRSPRRYVYNNLVRLTARHTKGYNHIPQTSTVALPFDYDFRICEILISQRQKPSSKRLSHICLPTPIGVDGVKV